MLRNCGNIKILLQNCGKIFYFIWGTLATSAELWQLNDFSQFAEHQWENVAELWGFPILQPNNFIMD
jgi:hypothetical protein